MSARPTSSRNRIVILVTLAVIGVAVIVGVIVQSSRSSTSKHAAVPPSATGPGGSYTKGNGSVLVEEYADFQCPSCGRFEQQTYPTVNELVATGRVTFAFHNFAFLGPESITMANAAACAGDAGKFWPLHDYFYDHQVRENSGFWSTTQLIAALLAVGADTPQTEQCVRRGTYVTWVNQQTDAGSRRGVTQTPSVFVNNQILTDTSPQGLLGAVPRR